MKKVVRLTENDLARLVRKVIKEQGSSKTLIREMQETEFKKFMKSVKYSPTAEQTKMKDSILSCIKKGNYPHLSAMIAMGSSCVIAVVGMVLAAFTFGFSTPLATVATGGCISSAAMSMGDFWAGVEKEVNELKKCVTG